MQKITPHLWFDKEAKEAAGFYTSLFENSRITHTSTIHDTPSGDCDILSFELRGQPFMAISAGPYFKFNPSISFIVNFDPSRDENPGENIDAVWDKLSEGGTVLMPIDKYPFSERYGWIQDKYGVSWQMILTNPEGEERPEIVPALLFTQDKCGKAEEAIYFYTSVFKESKKGALARYGPGQEPDKEGNVMFADFKLSGTWLAVMDSARAHNYTFNEAVSLLIPCESQEDIDYYWEKLSADPEAGQCGWLKDKFGVSWQVWPTVLGEMMKNGTQEQIDRVTQAFLSMTKYDIKTLKRAYEVK